MTAEQHLEAFFAAWSRHNSTEMAGFYADDAEMEDPTLAEPRRGRAAIERYYADMFAALEEPEHELTDHASRGGRIWFEWTFAHGRGAARARFRGVSIQTLRDGLIAHDAAFWNPDG